MEEVREKKEIKVKESEFGNKVRDHLKGKKIEVLDIVAEKKKEFVARVRIDIMFGKQDFYLIAKDKKNVSDNDLILAVQQAQGNRMPALFMCPGELSKKGRNYLVEWGNLVRWEKL